MSRVAAFLLAMLCATQASPCSDGLGDKRARDKADRIEQRRLVSELAEQADTIFIAKAVRVAISPQEQWAQFKIAEVLKGALEEGVLITYPVPETTVIGCSPAASFKYSWPKEDRRYLVYVREGTLLRVGDLERMWPEISAKEEGRLVRKIVAHDDV